MVDRYDASAVLQRRQRPHDPVIDARGELPEPDYLDALLKLSPQTKRDLTDMYWNNPAVYTRNRLAYASMPNARSITELKRCELLPALCAMRGPY